MKVKQAVLISIQPQWCEKIEKAEKTLEIRKSAPKLRPPFKCYIYRTQSKKGELGCVIGEFVCDGIEEINAAERIRSEIRRQSCIEPGEIHRYLGVGSGYGWHISGIEIYKTPKKLSELVGLKILKDGYEVSTIERPPQSWRYVAEM